MSIDRQHDSPYTIFMTREAPELLEKALRLHPKARAARWYRECNPDAAEAFLTELERALLRIAEAPESWPVVEAGRRRPGYWLDRQPRP